MHPANRPTGQTTGDGRRVPWDAAMLFSDVIACLDTEGDIHGAYMVYTMYMLYNHLIHRRTCIAASVLGRWFADGQPRPWPCRGRILLFLDVLSRLCTNQSCQPCPHVSCSLPRCLSLPLFVSLSHAHRGPVPVADCRRQQSLCCRYRLLLLPLPSTSQKALVFARHPSRPSLLCPLTLPCCVLEASPLRACVCICPIRLLVTSPRPHTDRQPARPHCFAADQASAPFSPFTRLCLPSASIDWIPCLVCSNSGLSTLLRSFTCRKH